METKEINVEKLCRACMTETDDKKTLFQNNNENNVKLSEMLSYCTSLQILDSDGLPNQICTVCELQLNSAYLFRKKCLVSDVELRDKLGLMKESIVVKQELEEVNSKGYICKDRFSILDIIEAKCSILI